MEIIIYIRSSKLNIPGGKFSYFYTNIFQFSPIITRRSSIKVYNFNSSSMFVLPPNRFADPPNRIWRFWWHSELKDDGKISFRPEASNNTLVCRNVIRIWWMDGLFDICFRFIISRGWGSNMSIGKVYFVFL